MTTANPARRPEQPSPASRRSVGWYAVGPRRPRPAAHGLLPAARRLGAAAHHRPDHGAQRVERLLLPAERRRLLRRRHAPADVGRDRHPVRLDRLPAAARRVVRRFAWPALLVAIVLLALVRVPGLGRRGQRQHQLARRRPVRDPARRDRQARDRALGGAHLRPQGEAARQPARAARPGRAGHRPRHRPGRARPATSAPRWCSSRSCSRCCGWSAHPARLFTVALTAVGVVALCLASTSQRAPRAAHQLRRPVQGLPRRRLAARPRPLRAVLAAAGLRPGHRRQPAEVGRPARGAHRLHLRRARRGARPGRHAAGDRAVPHHRVRRDPGRHPHRATRSCAT